MSSNLKIGFLVLTSALCVAVVHTYSSGAPANWVCAQQLPAWPKDQPIHWERRGPRYRVFRQANPARNPYRITVSGRRFNRYDPVIVNITGGPLKGFVIYAIEEGAEIPVKMGQFWPMGGNTDMKTLSCVHNNDTATHTDGKWKNGISFEWYAPMRTHLDNIVFKGTVVRDLKTFYLNVKSRMILPAPVPAGDVAAQAGGNVPADAALNGDALQRYMMMNSMNSMFGGAGASWFRKKK